jgi:hypothetical protein
MRIELIILFIAGIVAFNIYTEGKYVKTVMQYKKYWQIGAVAFGALVMCWLLRRDPSRAKDMLESTQSYLKYMPLDNRTTSMISPLLDFTGKNAFTSTEIGSRPIIALDGLGSAGSEASVIQAGGGSTGTQRFKRSVSETKKKFVASRQKWLCKECGTMLTATYEIDHIIRLDRGGSNHVDNLAALCPNCHRQKTMIENL